MTSSEQHVEPDRWVFEREARAHGHAVIAGVDEVGRAAWAGPMVAAAVILGKDFDASAIRSSKKMKPAARERAYDRILSEALAVSVQQVSASDLDTRGFDVCHMELLRDAVHGLLTKPDFVLVDHYTIPDLRYPQRSITRGDDASVSIAAASIVAKVECDRIMMAYAEQFPEYDFTQNKDTARFSTSLRSQNTGCLRSTGGRSRLSGICREMPVPS